MRQGNGYGWAVVAVLGPPACFIFGTWGWPGALAFLFTWSCIVACSCALAWSAAPAPPTAHLSRPIARRRVPRE